MSEHQNSCQLNGSALDGSGQTGLLAQSLHTLAKFHMIVKLRVEILNSSRRSGNLSGVLLPLALLRTTRGASPFRGSSPVSLRPRSDRSLASATRSFGFSFFFSSGVVDARFLRSAVGEFLLRYYFCIYRYYLSDVLRIVYLIFSDAVLYHFRVSSRDLSDVLK